MSSKVVVETARYRVYDAREWCRADLLVDTKNYEHEALQEYDQLLQELSIGSRRVSCDDFRSLLSMKNELLAFLIDGDAVVGTAQASLVFPGCQPTIWIEKVVISSNRRRQGLGQVLLLGLEQLVHKRFDDYPTIKLMLTSRAERGTQSFYEHLGYQLSVTNRYTKELSRSAP